MKNVALIVYVKYWHSPIKVFCKHYVSLFMFQF